MTRTVPENERAAAAALKAAGCIVWHTSDLPGDKRWEWFVGLGSHGSEEGETLEQAMKGCLDCCRLGMWWKMMDERRAADVFAEIGLKYLGGWHW
jgi:hypothetical protein